MPNPWPEFMRHDPISGLYYGNVETRFPEYVLVAQDETGEVVACAYSVPFGRDGGAVLANGWDFVIRSGLLASRSGQPTDAISAVEIAAPTAKARVSPGRCSLRCAPMPRVGASPSLSRRSVPTESRRPRADVDVRVPSA